MKLQLSRLYFVVLLMFFNPIKGNGPIHLEVTQPGMVQAEAGESVNISCSFMSLSPFYTVTWTLGCDNTKNLQDLPCFQHRVKIISHDDVQTPQSSNSSSNEKKTSLTIINVTENDSGRFCCHVKMPGAGGEKGTGAGTRLEVTRRSCPAGDKNNPGTPLKIYILYAVIGAEACIIIILIIVVIIRHRSRGLSRSEDQGLQMDPQGLQYAEICKKSFPQNTRPKSNMDTVTYSAVKTRREGHVTNQEYNY